MIQEKDCNGIYPEQVGLKAVILCGGKGMRLGNSGRDTAKTLALIKGKPIIWHIMRNYMRHGVNHFVLPLGHNGTQIRRYFEEYSVNNCDYMYRSNGEKPVQLSCENWTVTCVDAGLETMTGGRMWRILPYLDGDEFLMTYGDVLAHVDIGALIAFHRKHGKAATVIGVKHRSQYGVFELDADGRAVAFSEKPDLPGLINGGYFVLNKKVFEYMDEGDDCVFEQGPIERLVRAGEIAVYKHDGIWLSVETQRDIDTANRVWKLA